MIMCNEVEPTVKQSLLKFDSWMNENILEIIHRNGEFSTVTINTETGPRSFRCAGVNSLVDAVKKAKAYMGVV